MYFIHTFFKYQQETFTGQNIIRAFNQEEEYLFLISKFEINCINEIHNYFIENKYDK